MTTNPKETTMTIDPTETPAIDPTLDPTFADTLADIRVEFEQRAQAMRAVIAGVSDDDVYHLLRAIEERFEIKVSVIDRTEIGELFATCDSELTDERWEKFRNSDAWNDWSYDSWAAWKEHIGEPAVLDILDAEPKP